ARPSRRPGAAVGRARVLGGSRDRSVRRRLLVLRPREGRFRERAVVADARAARRAAQKRVRRDRPVVRGVFWREVALLLVCAEIAIFVLAFDPSVLNVFDLTKASFTHALAWGLPGALLVVAIAVSIDYPRRTSWLAWTIGAVAAIAGLYAVEQFVGRDPVQWVDLDPRSRPFSTFGNPDFYGQFLAVVFIGCAAALASARQRLWLMILVALLALSNLGLMLVVATRGSFLGIVAGAVVIAPLWLRRSGLSRPVL